MQALINEWAVKIDQKLRRSAGVPDAKRVGQRRRNAGKPFARARSVCLNPCRPMCSRTAEGVAAA